MDPVNIPAKFEVRIALSVPEIKRSTQEIWAILVYAHAPFFPKFLLAFVRMDPLNISAKFDTGKLPDVENPLFGATFVALFLVLAEF